MEREISMVHKILHWMMHNWEFTLIMVSGAFSAFMWWMHQVFTTHSTMHQCKKDVVGLVKDHETLLNQKIEKLEQSNDDSHNAIWRDVKWIKEFLIEHSHWKKE